MKWLILLILVFCMSPIVHGANILVLLTVVSRSIKNFFIPLAKELINRGHTVTIITGFPAETPSPGIKEVILPELKKLTEKLSEGFAPGKNPEPLYSYAAMGDFKTAIKVACDITIGSKEMQDIIAGKEKYDLVALHLLFEDCGLGIAKKLDLPFIYIATFGFPVQYANNLRVPSCMPYCPIFTMNGYSNKMTFMERLENSFTTVAVTWLRERYLAPAVDEVIQKRLGDIPPVLDIERNVSLIILNDHFSITHAAPVLPNIIHAACMHCKPSKPLPKELQDWVEGSGQDGFIYFSLGSFVPSHLMPKELLDTFVKVFSSLKQRVIWKTSLDDIPHLSKNVKLFKWLPQQDLLGHPKLRLFMTHGGLLSVQESAYHGVPLLGFPAGIDQPYNMRVVEDSGSGLVLNWKDITTETLHSTINQVINNPTYRKNAEIRQSIARDLQNSPLDTAVYWVEYVIRHNGAPQLRTGGLTLTWYQYYQVDVLAFLVVLLMLTLLLTYWIGRICIKAYKGSYNAKRALKTD